MKIPPLSYILFDFNGRIGRGVWVLFTVIFLVAELVLNAGLRAALGMPAPVLTGSDPFLAGFLRDRIDLVLGLIFLPPQLAIDVKRWHDIGVSGRNVLWLYAPLALLIALGEAGAGGSRDNPESYAVILIVLFIPVIVTYFITLAIRRGEPAPNVFG